VRKLFVLIVLGSLGFAVACGSGGGGQTPVGIPGGGGGTGNTLSIAVDGGPNQAQNGIYANGAFATATICPPGSTSNCVTVDHLLVDTGSAGLRVLQSEVASLNLPPFDATNGSAAFDCVAFADGSFLWGTVQSANVTLAGETASNVPIQVISSSPANIPTSCSNGNPLGNENTQALLGANGILGVGLEPTDCTLFFPGVGPTNGCDPNGGLPSPPTTSPAYFTCSSSSCTPQFMDAAKQVTNPVALLPVDNNGVIVELPAVSGSVATVTGSLIIGIGTESNNQLSSSANVYTVACDFFNTIFQNQTFAVDPSNCGGSPSFIDSGSNGYFFPDVTSPAIPTCPKSTPIGDLSTFYCPTTLQNLSAVNEDPNNLFQGPTVNFSVDNAENLFTSSSTSSDAALSTLGGPALSGGFDWGLPFFYGKNVYVSIDGQGVPTSAPSPWWAY
jgi:hypothetical protein